LNKIENNVSFRYFDNEIFNSSFMSHKAPNYIIALMVIVAGISVIVLSFAPQTTLAQQTNLNQTFSDPKQHPFLQDISFDINNVTFSHYMASVNGIQIHYVIGGQGQPILLLHGWPETWYAWHKVMPALAKNYTVIAPDLRGLGYSSKPPTGYDGNTTAEDIYQLVSQLGFSKIFLVAHDIGAQTAYSYTAGHPSNVSKLVIMDAVFPGFFPPNFEGVCWWCSFHQTRDIPELLTAGNERKYLSWHYRGLAYNREAITEADIDTYVSSYSAPGGMRAGFEYYRAFPVNAEQNKVLSETKLQMPVLVIGGDIYPALGGDLPGNVTLNSTQALAANVTGITVPLSGHYIAEEQPDVVVILLNNFFSGNSTTT
jgi:pimeloyl-ACP methyl ester carboxylesterase